MTSQRWYCNCTATRIMGQNHYYVLNFHSLNQAPSAASRAAIASMSGNWVLGYCCTSAVGAHWLWFCCFASRASKTQVHCISLVFSNMFFSLSQEFLLVKWDTGSASYPGKFPSIEGYKIYKNNKSVINAWMKTNYFWVKWVSSIGRRTISNILFIHLW